MAELREFSDGELTLNEQSDLLEVLRLLLERIGNFEGQCPSVLFKDNVPEHLAATDALRPDQEELVAEFVRQQRWPLMRGS